MCTSVSRCGAGGSNDFGESFREIGRNRSHSRHEGRDRGRRQPSRRRKAAYERESSDEAIGTLLREPKFAGGRQPRSPVAASSGLVAAMRSPGFATTERRTTSSAHDLHECSAGTPTRTSQVSADRPATPVTEVHAAVRVARAVSQLDSVSPTAESRKGAIEHPARTNYCDAFPAMAVIPQCFRSMARFSDGTGRRGYSSRGGGIPPRRQADFVAGSGARGLRR